MNISQEKIELGADQGAILKIAVIVIGALILAGALPDLCRYIFTLYQQQMMAGSSLTGGIVFNLVKSLVGYLLMTNSTPVVRFIKRHGVKEERKED